MQAAGRVGQATVAQRLCDLLLRFPAAAVGGVRWKVLVERYEERFGDRDIANLGHSSNLAAATALLWELLRMRGNNNPEDPLLAVEDEAALTARPGLFGTWPSLYASLLRAVGDGEVPLSELKALLKSKWHADFEEGNMSYFDEEGNLVKLRKLKDVVQAVLQWRDTRLEWRQSSGGKLSPADRLLLPRLELATSKFHDELVLKRSEETLLDGDQSPESLLSREVAHAAQRRSEEEAPSSLEEVSEVDPSEPPQKPSMASPLITPKTSPTLLSRTATMPLAAEKAGAAAPVWLEWLPPPAAKPAPQGLVVGDTKRIPTGIVGKLRSQFDRAATLDKLL